MEAYQLLILPAWHDTAKSCWFNIICSRRFKQDGGIKFCTDVKTAKPISYSSTSNPFLPIREMNFGKPFGTNECQTVSAMNIAEIIDKQKEVEEASDRAIAISRTISEKLPKSLPSPLLDLFDENNLSKSYTGLIKVAQKTEITLEEEEEW